MLKDWQEKMIEGRGREDDGGKGKEEDSRNDKGRLRRKN